MIFIYLYPMSREHAIVLYQPLLHRIASSILGSVSDAEDVVHDTFVKWLTIDTSKISNTKSYLIKAVTNNCLTHLENLERRKNELFKAIPHFIQEQRERHFDFDREVQQALDVIQHKLEPVERAVFLMREIFQLEYEEIQHALEKKKDHCRQLLHRAKKKLNSDAGADQPPKPHQPGFSEVFTNACQHGQLHELIQYLKGEIK